MPLAAWAGALPAAIPSPSQGVWHLGPLPLRAYALCILAGIVAATLLTQRRWAARGGKPEQVLDIAFWAVPFGIVGGRLYHVVSSPDAYFGPGGDPWRAFAIWEGGLGIWGAIALGAVGAWIGCRRAGVRLPPFADALAPGLLVAQAVGRLGNWFNQELFGGPTTLPWGLRIDDAHLPAGYDSGTLFHPTFLYELLWNLAAAVVLVVVDRRRRLGHGRVFWLYVALYTAGRFWIELLRIDAAETVLGQRLNVWVAALVCLGALVAFALVGRRHPDRDTEVLRPAPGQPQDREHDPEQDVQQDVEQHVEQDPGAAVPATGTQAGQAAGSADGPLGSR
ncbi:prolipoprotein diacylglyceryl transferase [Cellulomonas marina]|uniref:Phosphatidylglycerol--prolipoprotein diacylglyceryl transferase n=1 Tax=Cellulomonas marina TaxID=988821 RepID=A0A1I0ZQA8_9CELL|nr:prolipoprotein diacylglyceryl transferase [Cellulomonas marina]GIG28873.1 prolipoprotein diacylglyceryl transferase 2 [Cellulomonas marina]SFB27296.1 prolipoprotein diacylglyceryl transferase [Cellulomonas marina]